MTLEINAVSNRCNIACSYCYETPIRAIAKASYNLPAILDTVKKHNTEFLLFGGEPLLMAKADAELLWSYGFEKFKKNGIQTNGILIDSEWIELFKKYSVHVGLSIDGPGSLNGARCNETLTAKTTKNIESLSAQGVPWSVIITLSQTNCNRNKRKEFKDWLFRLLELGARAIRLHFLENDYLASRIRLSNEELIEVLEDLESTEITFDFFEEIKERVRSGHGGSCVFQGCDPYTTPAVQGVGPDGEMHNCGRIMKSGVDYLKAESHGNERDLALTSTSYDNGGCGGCRFFSVCRGYCPGTAINGDWRFRTEFCTTLLHFYEKYERMFLVQGQRPISLDPLKREEWRNRKKGYLHGDAHGDRYIIHVPVIRRGQPTSVGIPRDEREVGTSVPEVVQGNSQHRTKSPSVS